MKTERTIVKEVDTFEVGDIIDFTLSDGEEVQAMAVRQEENGMVFLFVDCLKDEYSMNESSYNSNGCAQSNLRKSLNENILDRFPSDLREKMIPFDNKDLLRLPTEKEIFGTNEYGCEESKSVKQFEPMKLRRNRMALRGKNGNVEWYWLSNPVKNSSAYFANVSYTGRAGYRYASNSYGVRPAFKI